MRALEPRVVDAVYAAIEPLLPRTPDIPSDVIGGEPRTGCAFGGC